jgi:phosphatidate cytidylyltransferase
VSEPNAAPAGATPVSSNLVMRVIAALVLVPIAVAIAYAGGAIWVCIVSLMAIGLYLEWLMVIGAGRLRGLFACGAIAYALVGLCLVLGWAMPLVLVVILGLAGIAVIPQPQRGWAAVGFAYIVAAQVASVLIRVDPVEGFSALMFVFIVVWVTDIGGYFAGRGIGGPKLWPSVSPKKTWAGAFGGFVASLIVAAGFAAAGVGKTVPLLSVGAVLSVVSQFGDLFESAVKRRFGVKDSSHLIPGHGGLLDRMDGFLAAILVASIFGFLRRGLDGVGSGLMVW